MAPKITDGSEIRFEIDSKHNLLVRSLTPKTNSDFVVTTAGEPNRDQGVLSSNTSARISESAFYVERTKVKDAGPGTNLFVKSAVGTPVVVVQIETKANPV